MARPRSLRAARNRHTAQFARELEVSTYVRRIAAERRELDDIEFRLVSNDEHSNLLSPIVNGRAVAEIPRGAPIHVTEQVPPSLTLGDLSGDRSFPLTTCTYGAPSGALPLRVRIWSKYVVWTFERTGEEFVFDRGLYRQAYEAMMTEYLPTEHESSRRARLLLHGPWWGGAQAMGLEPTGAWSNGSGGFHIELADAFWHCRVFVKLPWDDNDPDASFRAVARAIARWDPEEMEATWVRSSGEHSVPPYPASWVDLMARAIKP